MKPDKLRERLDTLSAVIESEEPYFDGDGQYIDGVVDALKFALGECDELMPWLKPKKERT